MKKDRPLKSVENLISEMSLKKIPETTKEVIIRYRIEIFIPTTHLSTEPMKRLARGKFWGPKINKEVEEIYSHCKPCRSEAIAKLQKPCEICPLFLDSLAPGQVIHLNYLEYDSKHIFILKDQYSSWSKYYLTSECHLKVQ